MKLKRIAQGVAIGLASGFLATIATTPKSGTEVRSSLKATSDSLKAKKDDVSTHVAALKQSVQHFNDVTKNNIPSIVNDIKASVTTFTTEIRPVAANLQHHANQMQAIAQELQQEAANFKKDKKEQKETSEPVS